MYIQSIETMTASELKDARTRTLTAIEQHEKKPFHVQFEFSNALDARLGRIERLIAENGESCKFGCAKEVYRGGICFKCWSEEHD